MFLAYHKPRFFVIALVSAFFLAVFSVHVVYASLDAGAVSIWHFDEGSGRTTADYGAKNFDLNLVNAGWTTPADARFGNSALQNPTTIKSGEGDGFENTANYGPIFANTGAFTVEAWIYSTDQSWGADQYVVARQNYEQSSEEGDWGLGIVASNAYFGMYHGGAWTTIPGGFVALNTWTHLAGSWDGSYMRLFVNGAEVASAALSGVSDSANTHGIAIGHALNGLRSFAGRIDEARIYNRALSADEIKQRFEANFFHQDSWSGGPSPDEVTNQSYGWQKYNSSANISAFNGKIRVNPTFTAFSATFSDDFEDGDYSGWNVVSGSWSAGNKYLQVTSYGVNKIEREFRLVSNSIFLEADIYLNWEVQGLAINLRASDGTSLLSIRRDSGPGRGAEFAVLDGSYSTGFGEYGNWRRLRVEAALGVFRAYLDGKLVHTGSYTEKEFSIAKISAGGWNPIRSWWRLDQPGQAFDNITIGTLSLNKGDGQLTSSPFDSGSPGTEWGNISWTGLNVPSLIDDFEYTDSILNRGWKDFGGQLRFETTTEQSKSGAMSLKLGPDGANNQRTVGKPTQFGQDFVFTAWFYDNGAAQSFNTIYAARDATGLPGLGVGLNTGSSPDKYVYGGTFSSGGGMSGGTISNVARSTGWHKFQIKRTGTTVSFAIDDVQQTSTKTMSEMPNLVLISAGSSGAPSLGYWDSIYFGDPSRDPSIALQTRTSEDAVSWSEWSTPVSRISDPSFETLDGWAVSTSPDMLFQPLETIWSTQGSYSARMMKNTAEAASAGAISSIYLAPSIDLSSLDILTFDARLAGGASTNAVVQVLLNDACPILDATCTADKILWERKLVGATETELLNEEVLLTGSVTGAHRLAFRLMLLGPSPIGEDVSFYVDNLRFFSAYKNPGQPITSPPGRYIQYRALLQGAQTVAPPDANTIALWHLNERSGTTAADSSPNGLTGTLGGPAKFTATNAKFGASAIDTTAGTGAYVHVPYNQVMNTNQVTAEGWFYLSSYRGGVILGVLGRSYVPGGDSWWMWVRDSNSATNPKKLEALINAPTKGYAGVAANTEFPVGRWVHVAMTYDGATLLLYQNGVVVGSEAINEPIVASTAPILIGGSRDSVQTWNGYIDEVRISNTARTAAEIAAAAAARPVFISPILDSVTITYTPPPPTISIETVNTFLTGLVDSVTALAKPLTATDQNGAAYPLVIDADPATSETIAAGLSLTLDLGETKTVSGVRLTNDAPFSYEIQLSTDGTIFTTVARGTAAAGVNDITFAAQDAQFIKIINTDTALEPAALNEVAAIVETQSTATITTDSQTFTTQEDFETGAIANDVLTTAEEIMLAETPTPIPLTLQSTTAPNLIDGSIATTETLAAGQSFDFDLGVTKTLTSIQIETQSAFAYEMQVSLDGETWTTIATDTATTPTTTITPAAPVTARYIRVINKGTAAATLAEVSATSGFVSSGSLASKVLDSGAAGTIWSSLEFDITAPAGTNYVFEVRASDTLFSADDTTLPWVKVEGASPLVLPDIKGRYFQWRVTLSTTDATVTPVLDDATVNFAPLSELAPDKRASLTIAAGTATIEFLDFLQSKADYTRQLNIISRLGDLPGFATVQGFLAGRGLKGVDFVWVDNSAGFLAPGTYTAKVTLPSTYDVLYYCAEPGTAPGCTIIEPTTTCPGPTLPCFNTTEIAGKTTVYAASFSGAGGAEDVTPPVILSADPPNGTTLDKGTRSVDVQLVTDEVAECRFETVPGVAFQDMSGIFTSTDSTVHTFTLDTPEDGRNYSAFIRCQDEFGNTNPTDTQLEYRVSEIFLPTVVGPVTVRFAIEAPVINLQVGSRANLLVRVRNPTGAAQEVPLHIGSSKELRNWIWFSGHERDEFRRDLNVTVRAGDEVSLAIVVLPGKVGQYDLIVGPNATAVYDSKLIVIQPGPAGLFGVAPDLGVGGFLAILGLAALFLFKPRKITWARRKL